MRDSFKAINIGHWCRMGRSSSAFLNYHLLAQSASFDNMHSEDFGDLGEFVGSSIEGRKCGRESCESLFKLRG